MTARVSIDLNALQHNYRWACLQAPQLQNMAVIKGNAYGHGAVQVAKALTTAPAFACSRIEEALRLRAANIRQPILILEGAITVKDWQICSQNNFWVNLHSLSQWHTLKAAGVKTPIVLWVKLDLGMHRLGLNPIEFSQCWEDICRADFVEDIVLMGHHADAMFANLETMQSTLSKFEKWVKPYDFCKSIANSAAFISHIPSRLDWNRLGFMLYGVTPFHTRETPQLKPVMTFTGNIIALRSIDVGARVGYAGDWVANRKSIIATVSLGYDDGYPQFSDSGTPVFVNNQKAVVVGRVSMHLTTIDITDVHNINVGDSVEFWGKNISVTTVAKNANVSTYDLLIRAGKLL